MRNYRVINWMLYFVWLEAGLAETRQTKVFHYYNILTYNAIDNLAQWLQALLCQIYTDQHSACTLCRCSAFQACQKIFRLHHKDISFISNQLFGLHYMQIRVVCQQSLDSQQQKLCRQSFAYQIKKSCDLSGRVAIIFAFFWSDFVKNCDMMCQQSVWSSVLAAQLAAKHLKEGGVLTLTGAQPALSGTAGKTIQF